MSADASPSAFVDTNVFVYALAGDDAKRSVTAQNLLRSLMAAQMLRTSTQVLQELYVTLTRKVQRPLKARDALAFLDQIAAWPVIAADFSAVREAAELSETAVLNFWDALVIVAAARSGAEILYSEDLQDGRRILGLKIVNPFHGSTRHEKGVRTH